MANKYMELVVVPFVEGRNVRDMSVELKLHEFDSLLKNTFNHKLMFLVKEVVVKGGESRIFALASIPCESDIKNWRLPGDFESMDVKQVITHGGTFGTLSGDTLSSDGILTEPSDEEVKSESHEEDASGAEFGFKDLMDALLEAADELTRDRKAEETLADCERADVDDRRSGKLVMRTLTDCERADVDDSRSDKLVMSLRGSTKEYYEQVIDKLTAEYRKVFCK